MEEIKCWFDSGCHYDEGLALLAKHSKNRHLITSLSRKQNDNKLRYELGKIAKVSVKQSPIKKSQPADNKEGKIVSKEDQEETQVVEQQGKIYKIVRNQRTLLYDELPGHIKTIVNENTILYKKMRSIHEKLKLMGDMADEDRMELVNMLCVMDEKVRYNWSCVDNWEPGQEEPMPEENKELTHKEINAARKYISSSKGKLKTDKEMWQPRIQERVDLLLNGGEEFNPNQVEELKELGIVFNAE